MTRDTSDLDQARYEMWVKLIPGYASLSRSGRVDAKYKYAESLGKKCPGEVETRTTTEVRMEHKFNFGDIVDVSEEYDGWPAGMIGTILWYDNLGPLVEFANAKGQGHSGYGKNKGKENSCWYIPEEMLSLSYLDFKELVCYPAPIAKKKKEEDMYTTLNVQTVATADTTERSQRDHLLNRIFKEFCSKDVQMRRDFWLDEMKEPQTAAEAVQRIKDGLFELPGDDDFDGGYTSIRWRDPSKKADLAGYKAALEKMKTARQDAEDEITILAPEKGLETLRRFCEMQFN